MMRAVVYCRVSTKEQAENLSLPTQKKACLDYCARHGLEVDRVFMEPGESAKTIARPAFKQLLDHCLKIKGRIQYLIVYSISRFSRSSLDYQMVKNMLAKKGIMLRSVTENIDDSSSGRFLEAIMAAWAQLDNDIRSERTRAGMKAAMERGRWPHRPPLGYSTSPPESRSPSLRRDEGRACLVARAFEMYSSGGMSKAEVRRAVNRMGLRTRRGSEISAQTFDSMLRNPLYCGRVISKGLEVDVRGDFEPIVSEELFMRVQARLEGKISAPTLRKRDNPEFPLRRFVRCAECGTPMTGSPSSGRSKQYLYYRCRKAGHVHVSKQALEARFLELLDSLRPKRECLRLYQAIVEDVWEQRTRDAQVMRRGLERQLEDLAARRDKLERAFIYLESIDEETFERQRRRLEDEIADVELEIVSSSTETIDLKSVLGFAERVMTGASTMWLHGTPAQRLGLQTAVFPAGLEFDGESFGTVETNPAFRWLQEIQEGNPVLATPTGFEPVLPA